MRQARRQPRPLVLLALRGGDGHRYRMHHLIAVFALMIPALFVITTLLSTFALSKARRSDARSIRKSSNSSSGPPLVTILGEDDDDHASDLMRGEACTAPFPGFPKCEEKINWLEKERLRDPNRWHKIGKGRCGSQEYYSQAHRGRICPQLWWHMSGESDPHYSISADGVREFFVYRAESTKNDWHRRLEDTNAGNLGGVLAYIHTEVLPQTAERGIKKPKGLCHRRMDIDAVIVFKVRVKNPWDGFGAFFAYNSGRCEGCAKSYHKNGYFVGYQRQYSNPRHAYADGSWYSFPELGECDGVPTGERTCTYSYDIYKVIPLDMLSQLEASTGFDSLDKYCGIEYAWGPGMSFCDTQQDSLPFWDAPCDARKCRNREEALERLVLSSREIRPLKPLAAHPRLHLALTLTGQPWRFYRSQTYPRALPMIRNALIFLINNASGVVRHHNEHLIYREDHVDVQIHRMTSTVSRVIHLSYFILLHTEPSYERALGFFNVSVNPELVTNLQRQLNLQGLRALTLEDVGVRGKFCESPSPCDHGECISDDSRGYRGRCECTSGFIGQFCDTPVPGSCGKVGCDHGGRCSLVDGVGFTCECKFPWGGPNCTVIPPGSCEPPCTHGGVCDFDDSHDLRCWCPDTWASPDCEQHYAVPVNCNTYRNGKTLVDVKEGHRRKNGSDEGTAHESDGSVNWCLNGGTCSKLQDGRTWCFCPSEWGGPSCEHRVRVAKADPGVPEYVEPTVKVHHGLLWSIGVALIFAGVVSLLATCCCCRLNSQQLWHMTGRSGTEGHHREGVGHERIGIIVGGASPLTGGCGGMMTDLKVSIVAVIDYACGTVMAITRRCCRVGAGMWRRDRGWREVPVAVDGGEDGVSSDNDDEDDDDVSFTVSSVLGAPDSSDTESDVNAAVSVARWFSRKKRFWAENRRADAARLQEVNPSLSEEEEDA